MQKILALNISSFGQKYVSEIDMYNDFFYFCCCDITFFMYREFSMGML